MSNGAGAAKRNLARAAVDTVPHGPLGDAAAGPVDAGLMGLLFDDAMDGGGALEASQISQTQIIERQAETIARLERHAARDKEYRTVTKVKLKEAAARLKEYRLRVEALLEEAEVAKQTMARLEAEKKALAHARKKPTSAAKKAVELVTVGVQTPWKTATRTVSVQTNAAKTRAIEVQTDAVMAAVSPENDPPDAGMESKPVALKEVAEVISASSDFDAIGAAIDAELDFSDDDEDVDDDGDKNVPVAKPSVTTGNALAGPELLLDDAISHEINKELDFSSSDDVPGFGKRDGKYRDKSVAAIAIQREGGQSAKSEVTAPDPSLNLSFSVEARKPTETVQTPNGDLDAIGQAIDDELASDSESDQNQEPTTEMSTTENARVQLDPRTKPPTAASVSEGVDASETPANADRSSLTSLPPELSKPDLVGIAIDTELMSSSDDELVEDVTETVSHMKTPVLERPAEATDDPIENANFLNEKARTLSVSSDSSDDSTSSSDDSENERNDSIDLATLRSTASAQGIREPVLKKNNAEHRRFEANLTQKHETGEIVGDVKSTALGKRPVDATVGDETVHQPRTKAQKPAPFAVSEEPKRVEKAFEDPAKSSTTTAAAIPGTLHPREAATLKAALGVQDGEAVDIAYVMRTLGMFIKCVANHLRVSSGTSENKVNIFTNPGIVKLSKMLVNEHVRRSVHCDLLIEAMMRVFRTPRTRHTVEKSHVTLPCVFQVLLFQRLDSLQCDKDGDEVCTVGEMLPEIHHYLHLLRDSIVPSRLISGFALPQIEGKDAIIAAAVSSTRIPTSVSQDNGFLSHVCAFYATICRELNRSDLSRILLLDVLQCHPNIKGLYCVHAMVQNDPSVLQKHWDTRGREQHSVLRGATVHVLQSITAESLDKQEVIFRESAVSLLSSIAEWIDDPLVMLSPHGGISGSPKDMFINFSAILWRNFVKPCIVSVDPRRFEVSLALELLGSVYSETMIAAQFPISSFLSVTGPGEGNGTPSNELKPRQFAQIALFIGALTRGILRAGRDQFSRVGFEAPFPSLFVCDAIAWMLEISCGEEIRGEELSTIVGEVTYLLVGISTHKVGLKQRDEWLRQLLKLLPKNRLAHLSAQSLRQLCLLVTSARPMESRFNQCVEEIPVVLV